MFKESIQMGYHIEYIIAVYYFTGPIKWYKNIDLNFDITTCSPHKQQYNNYLLWVWERKKKKNAYILFYKPC